MKTNETITIERVGNGFIVQPKMLDGHVIALGAIMVFETTEALVAFIRQHYPEDEAVMRNGEQGVA